MAERIDSIGKGHAKLNDERTDLLTHHIGQILDKAEESDITDIAVVGMRDNEIIFVGETGLRQSQKREFIQFALAKWLPDD